MSAARIPNVHSLSFIIPKGAEGAKEFARIIGLLLFQESRRNDRKMTLFNDAAGDYNGLDSFEDDPIKGMTGYQIKFFPSPLSDAHRREIKISLLKATSQKARLKKWVLVTPDDLLESSMRAGGGDITWFENLREDVPPNIDIEHFGHTKIIGMFLESRSLCLFYYPELVPDAVRLKRSIQETRSRYDENLLSYYKNIDFVGMSIYKPEAAKGIPMESIYIPLKVTPESNDTKTAAKEANCDPVMFLHPGMRVVILGDPGSGKSTLLRFMALCGISQLLRERYNTQPNTRLPIIVTLQRYVDELKGRANLSLVDFIRESMQAEFSLTGFDIDFLEFWLDSGQANLFFDGLDELPDPLFKKIVRDRIRAMATTYPGNNIVVSSRIVGYDHPFQFDESEFLHYKINPLELQEMEQFVHDWYAARIENPYDRKTHSEDLIRILRDEGLKPIRELSQNPLLLTIVTLVHRIDAVLPDERVVLYQKCTETLLNTWHGWKSRGRDVQRSGKTERRNRSRMENIAYWMHTQGLGTGKRERSVVTYEDLLHFLTGHIAKTEVSGGTDEEAEDLARDFIEFIKEKAGLLIELGDRRFSFVHLTFQEYLCATYLITISEHDGVAAVYQQLSARIDDPRWYEVIRLLVAGFRSEESQEYFIVKFLADRDTSGKMRSALLLGGFLLDAVSPAEAKAQAILSQVIISATQADQKGKLSLYIRFIETWIQRDKAKNEGLVVSAFMWLLGEKEYLDRRREILLIAIIVGLNQQVRNVTLPELLAEISSREDLNFFNEMLSLFSLRSGELLAIPAFLQVINFGLDIDYAMEKMFHIFLMHIGMAGASYVEIIMGIIFFSKKSRNPETDWINKVDWGRIMRNQAIERQSGKYSSFNPIESFLKAHNIGEDRIIQRQASVFHKITLSKNLLKEERNYIHKNFLYQAASSSFAEKGKGNVDNVASVIITESGENSAFANLLGIAFQLGPRVLWYEAILNDMIPRIPQVLNIFFQVGIDQIKRGINQDLNRSYYVHLIACQVLIDGWFRRYIYDEWEDDDNLFAGIVEFSREMKDPVLRLAHCIRDLYMGDSSRLMALEEMYQSREPEHHGIFVACRWKD